MVFTVAVLLAVGALGFVIMVREKDVPEAPPPSPTKHLEERKAQIYDNLRDLQFEYRVGKLSDEDYQKTKLDLQKELAKVLAEIDALKPQSQVPHPAPVVVKAAAPVALPKADGLTCPHCATSFPVAMKFCGSCGKVMA